MVEPTTDAELALLSLIVGIKLMRLGHITCASQMLGCDSIELRIYLRSRLTTIELPDYEDVVQLLMEYVALPSPMDISVPFADDLSAQLFVLDYPAGAPKERVANHFKIRPSTVTLIEEAAYRKFRRALGGVNAKAAWSTLPPPSSSGPPSPLTKTLQSSSRFQCEG